MTLTNDGDIITVNEGQLLVVKLEAQPGTGYTWAVDTLPSVLQQAGSPTIEADDSEQLPTTQTADTVGNPVLQVFQFQPIQAGQDTLSLIYHRSWETGVAPAETFTLQIETQGEFTDPPPPVEITPTPNQSQPTPDMGPDLALPSAYNWCDNGGCTPVKNQGQCGSCWAFATVGVVESLIKIADGIERDLSEQYLVSAGTHGSCSGGYAAFSLFIDEVPAGEPEAGAVYEADFPYQAADVPLNPPHTHHEKLESYEYVNGTVADIQQAIHDYGPVYTSVCASGSAFQGYTSGVYETDESYVCPYGTDHAVVLVGWDDSLGTNGAWIMRNSWGSNWGDNGYMRIGYGISNIGSYARYAVYNGTGTDIPSAPYSLTASSISTSDVSLSWVDTSSNESGFKIERSLAGSGNWSEIAIVGGNTESYTDTGLDCDTTYDYRVYAYNANGNSSYSNTDTASTNVCITCVDAYEPDNMPAEANTFTLNNPQTHALCVTGDQDWVSFTATAGTTYRIETSNLTTGTDTYLELYAGDGSTQITFDDDGGAGVASLIEQTLSTDGTYYVKVRHYSSTAGNPAYTYDLNITSSFTIDGYVRDPDGNGISGVTVDFGGAQPSVTTDSNGYYSQFGFTNGSYTISASATDYMFSPYEDSITVSNSNMTHNITGTTLTPAGLPFSDGFESGNLSGPWAIETDYEGRVQISNTYPYTGNYSLLLDDAAGNVVYSHAAAVLALDLSGQSDVDLSFVWRGFDDENDADDGIFISDDNGATWQQVFSFNNAPISFTQETIDLDAAASTAGVSLTSQFLVKFQFYDNYPISSDGYAIDSVQVMGGATSTANLSMPTRSGNPGETIQVPIDASDVQGLLAADLTITYDSAVLSTQSVNTGSLTSGWIQQANTATPGQVVISMAGTLPASGDGTLATIEFLITGQPGDTSPLQFTNVLLNDGAMNATTTDGFVTVNALSLSGVVRFWNTNSTVSGVSITLSGDTSAATSTDAGGTYTFTNLAPGAYTATPAKTDGVNGITSFDAALVLQHAVGTNPLSGHAAIAADVNKSGSINSMDAAYIMQYSVGLITLPFPGAGTIWEFDLPSHSYNPLNSSQSNQDFTAILIGDPSGGWSNTNPAPAPASEELPATLRLETSEADAQGYRTTVVWLDDLSIDMYSLDLVLSNSLADISIQADARTEAYQLVTNLEAPDGIRVALAGATPLTEDGPVLTIRYQSQENHSETEPEILLAQINEQMVVNNQPLSQVFLPLVVH
ncbi:MAG: C1 family peptidase [Chloroflexaceae bacterium]